MAASPPGQAAGRALEQAPPSFEPRRYAPRPPAAGAAVATDEIAERQAAGDLLVDVARGAALSR